MELTIPVYAKTISEALNAHRSERPAATITAMAPRAVPPARRPLGGLFRGATPSTFHRCLAVHIHYAQRASALD